ncbi:MAG TPA: hypothetical protein VLW52_02215, partial [Opitutaceae bacterium]|nr:hypothetical protein [Opitutaceae bacterium]
INAEAADKKLALDLGGLTVSGAGTLITDGDAGNCSFRQVPVRLSPGENLELTLPPSGGFVLTLE